MVLKDGQLLWADNNYVLCWAVSKNGKVTAFTTQPSFRVDDPTATYSVRSVNEMGGMGDAVVAHTASGISSPIVAGQPDAALYSVTGQRVGKSYKGIVLKNGKKFVNR